MFQVSLSISTKSIEAPQFIAQFAEATKVFGTVHTISFFFKPRAKQPKCNALDALLAAAQILLLIF